MPRNYSLPTIKTLFAEARECAHPDCNEPLVLRERDCVTVVADIAHIRSEVPGGPRYDAAYPGDVDGVDNLLLLCVKHHRPVDRHESAYSISELEHWKEQQRLTAGSGTTVPESELRRYDRLSDEERSAMAQVARLTERLALVCQETTDAKIIKQEEAEQKRLASFASFGPMYEVNDDGTRTPVSSDSFRLSQAEQDSWNEMIRYEFSSRQGRIEEARRQLSEELAVLRMMMPTLHQELSAVDRTADFVSSRVGKNTTLEESRNAFSYGVSSMWRAASGFSS